MVAKFSLKNKVIRSVERNVCNMTIDSQETLSSGWQHLGEMYCSNEIA